MSYRPHPAFQGMFTAFTSEPDSIGIHLADRMVDLAADAPLLVTTGTDIALFPGAGRAPHVESFRRSTRGFIELTGVSHLPLAVAWIMRLRELDDPAWKTDALRLLDRMASVRAVNSERHWREDIAVEAFAGLEAKIAAMVDYTCAVTTDFLRRELASAQGAGFTTLRDSYLEPRDSAEVPVPINDVMAATFGLAFLDIGHRIIGWLRNEAMDWDRMMVMITGRTGRVTSGFTWATNNMCHLLWRASGKRLTPEQLYIAPHAPSLDLDACTDDRQVASLEGQFRQIWLKTRASVEMAGRMFDGYPAFQNAIEADTLLDAQTRTVDRMPTLRSVDDRLAIMTRLRLVLEDPAQLISNAAAHYVIDQLCACGNRPGEVVIHGLTHTHYPELRETAAAAS